MFYIVHRFVLHKEVIKVDIRGVSDHEANLRNEGWWCITNVLCFEEEIQVTWEEDDITVRKCDR
jgi:hypothetical protein